MRVTSVLRAGERLVPASRRRPPRSPTKATVPIPTSPAAWLREIAAAYADAHETIPFGPLVNVEISERDLFHLASAVCLKFRGIGAARTTLKHLTYLRERWGQGSSGGCPATAGASSPMYDFSSPDGESGNELRLLL